MGHYEDAMIWFEDCDDLVKARETGILTKQQQARIALWEAIRQRLAQAPVFDICDLWSVYVGDDGLVQVSLALRPSVEKLLKKTLLNVFKKTPPPPSLKLLSGDVASAMTKD